MNGLRAPRVGGGPADTSGRLRCLHYGAEHLFSNGMSRSNRDIAEPCGTQPSLILAERQCAGDASHVAPALRSLLGRQRISSNDIGHANPSTRLEDASHLVKDLLF